MNTPTKLPVFKGYVVDYRLREFRLMNYPDQSEFISFQSPQGFKMLQEYESTLLAIDKETGTCFDDWTNEYGGDLENPSEFDCDSWTQVCDSCAKKFHLLDSYLSIGEAPDGTICGVKGCNNLAEHYYDFKGIRE